MKYLFIPLAVTLLSCAQPQNKGVSVDADPIATINVNNTYPVEFYVIVIDSCEYITSRPGAYGPKFTHKGNCKFCAQRATK